MTNKALHKLHIDVGHGSHEDMIKECTRLKVMNRNWTPGQRNWTQDRRNWTPDHRNWTQDLRNWTHTKRSGTHSKGAGPPTQGAVYHAKGAKTSMSGIYPAPGLGTSTHGPPKQWPDMNQNFYKDTEKPTKLQNKNDIDMSLLTAKYEDQPKMVGRPLGRKLLKNQLRRWQSQFEPIQ